MPDEKRDRFIEGFRWCPWTETIQPWEEDKDFGCVWCENDLDSKGPHGKLVMARYADAAWERAESLQAHLCTLSYAEVGEPEEVVAQMYAHYVAACRSQTFPAQITNLIKGMAVVAVRAVANGRWARKEHENAEKLHETLTAVLEATKPAEGDWLPEDRRVVLVGARAVLEETRLYSQPPEPPFAVDFNLPVPDPLPEGAQGEPFEAKHESACPNCPTPIQPGDRIVWVGKQSWAHVTCPPLPPEAPEAATARVAKMHESGHHHECAGPCNTAWIKQGEAEPAPEFFTRTPMVPE